MLVRLAVIDADSGIPLLERCWPTIEIDATAEGHHTNSVKRDSCPSLQKSQAFLISNAESTIADDIVDYCPGKSSKTISASVCNRFEQQSAAPYLLSALNGVHKFTHLHSASLRQACTKNQLVFWQHSYPLLCVILVERTFSKQFHRFLLPTSQDMAFLQHVLHMYCGPMCKNEQTNDPSRQQSMHDLRLGLKQAMLMINEFVRNLATRRVLPLCLKACPLRTISCRNDGRYNRIINEIANVGRWFKNILLIDSNSSDDSLPKCIQKSFFQFDVADTPFACLVHTINQSVVSVTKKFKQHVMNSVDILLLWQLLKVSGLFLDVKDEQMDEPVLNQCLYLPNSMPKVQTKIVSFRILEKACLIGE